MHSFTYNSFSLFLYIFRMNGSGITPPHHQIPIIQPFLYLHYELTADQWRIIRLKDFSVIKLTHKDHSYPLRSHPEQKILPHAYPGTPERYSSDPR